MHLNQSRRRILNDFISPQTSGIVTLDAIANRNKSPTLMGQKQLMPDRAEYYNSNL